MLRLACLFFLLSSPAMASISPDPWLKDPIRPSVILKIAQMEMPLPVLEVATRLVREGQREFVVRMSTARLPSVREPVFQLAFEIDDKGGSLEQAFREASVCAREFLKAVRSDANLKELSWGE
jgi:hypothetical protein